MHETHSLRERFLVFFKNFCAHTNLSVRQLLGSLCGHYHDWSIRCPTLGGCSHGNEFMESFFYLLNRYRLCLGSDYRAPSRGRSQGSSSSRFLSISLYGFRSITDPLCPRFSGGTLSSGTLRFGTCGQKGSPWLPTLFEPWNYSPSAL